MDKIMLGSLKKKKKLNLMILGVHITSTKIFDGDIKNYILHVFEILSNLKVTFYISPNLGLF